MNASVILPWKTECTSLNSHPYFGSQIGVFGQKDMNYVKLRKIVTKLEYEHGIHGLCHISREILHLTADANMMGEKFRVGDLRKVKSLGTFPTIHSRLRILEKAGWIECKEDPEDRRSILLQITSKTRSKFSEISKALNTF